MNGLFETGGKDVMDGVEKYRAMEVELRRIAELAGAAAGVEQRAIELDLLGQDISLLAAGEEAIMSVGQVLRDKAAEIKENAQTVKTAVDNAITRLSDNPTAADIEAAVADLNTASTTLADASTAADAIDPDVPAVGVVDDGSGGVTEVPA